jgi:methylenetetrahydrofolate dehydrogenase (NADP+)/methenyltetrahydrofolate cyclohydrolase
MKLMDGKLVSQAVKDRLKSQTAERVAQGKKIPHLAAILIGNNGASETYVGSKVKSCAEIGYKSTLIRLEENVSEQELLFKLNELNDDFDIDGMLVQLPLPKHISEQKIIETILPSKDVDGFHPESVGRMVQGLPAFYPATPYGILLMLQEYGIDTAGKHCVVIGRSNIVGSPMSILMARNTNPGNCTVTICHSRTPDIKKFSLDADILIVAIGKKNFVTADMVKNGAIVIDVGMNREVSTETKSGFKLYGDVDFENVAPKTSWITPVPGGVGLMTIVGLLKNTLASAKKEIY